MWYLGLCLMMKAFAAMQAISVIVTHRTDDMSRLPPVVDTAATRPRAACAAAARPRLALPGAPSRTSEPDPAPVSINVGSPGAPSEGAPGPSGTAPFGCGNGSTAAGCSVGSGGSGGSGESALPGPLQGASPACAAAPAEAPRSEAGAPMCRAGGEGACTGGGPACGAGAVGAVAGDAAGQGYGRATLVICPLVAVIQWGQEIERFVAPNTLKARPCVPRAQAKPR